MREFLKLPVQLFWKSTLSDHLEEQYLIDVDVLLCLIFFFLSLILPHILGQSSLSQFS